MSIKFRKTTEDELLLIVDEGEGYSLEFKLSVNTDIAKELVAFANASGGRIFIGINDNNQIVGCDTSNKAISQIEDMAASCDPKVAINIEKLTAHNILVIHIPEGANRPHRCNKGFFCAMVLIRKKCTPVILLSLFKPKVRFVLISN